MNGNGNGKTWEWLWRGMTIIFLPWAVWITLTIMDIKTSIAVIEGNRFTSQDALNMSQAISRKVDRDAVPPAWFIDRVDGLEVELREHIREE